MLRPRWILLAALLPAAFVAVSAQPLNDPPNPYRTVEHYFRLPAGRSWGAASAVDIDKDGRSIWVAQRCGSSARLQPS